MLGWSDGRIIDQSSHGDVDEGAVANERVEKRTTPLTAGVAAVFVAEDHQAVLAFGEGDLVPLDAREGLEGRTRCSAAVGAVAVRGIAKFVRDLVLHRAAEACAGELALACLRRVCHELTPSRPRRIERYPRQFRHLCTVECCDKVSQTTGTTIDERI